MHVQAIPYLIYMYYVEITTTGFMYVKKNDCLEMWTYPFNYTNIITTEKTFCACYILIYARIKRIVVILVQ